MGRDTIIENPVINSAFAEPARHFRFDHDGITDDIVEIRRTSAYFVPIAQPKKKGKKHPDQLTFDTEWTLDRIKENDFINQVRAKVAAWRRSRHPGVTNMTRRLLEYWTPPTATGSCSSARSRPPKPRST